MGMKTVCIGLGLNLILIPLCWLLPFASRIPVYTGIALADLIFYLAATGIFLRRMWRAEDRRGFTLLFTLLQLYLLTVIFLFKLTELLLLRACS